MKIKIRLRPISAQKYLEINEKKYNNQILSNLNTLNNSFNIQKNCANNISNLISLNKLNYKHPLKHNFIKDEKNYYFDINNKIMNIAQIIEKKNYSSNNINNTENNNNHHHHNHHNHHNHNNNNNNHNHNHNHKLKNLLPPINLKKINIKEQINNTLQTIDSSNNLSHKLNNLDEKEYLINLIHDLNNDISCTLKNTNNKKNEKFHHLKTIYKYINDAETSIKFHYFLPDFIDKNKFIDNPEYKFIKIKNKSFQICKMFTKILNIIIKYFYIVYNNDKLTNYKYIHQYFLKIKELYNTYKKELDDIIENYANITNNLIIDYKVYKHYINDLCEFADLNINNEKEFKLNLENYDKRFEYLMK